MGLLCSFLGLGWLFGTKKIPGFSGFGLAYKLNSQTAKGLRANIKKTNKQT